MKKTVKLYGLFAILGVIIFDTCLITGLIYRKYYIVFIGSGILAIIIVAYSIYFFREVNAALKENSEKQRTAEKEKELLEDVNTATNRYDSKLAQANYYASGVDTAELFASALGFSKENKEAYKTASKKDKAKVILIYASLFGTMLLFIVGIGLTAIGSVGFIVMGIGGGGFFLIILSFLIISVNQRKSHYKHKSINDASGFHFCKGIVERCSIHSQHIVGRHTPRISGTLYMIYVAPEIGNKKFWLTSSDYFEKGAVVHYYESLKNSKKRFITKNKK
jgi:membrane protein implicated in regulation of membrane protease activity